MGVELYAKSFGAEGDGVTDDTCALNDMSEEAVCRGGAILRFGPHTYHIAGQWALPSNVRIVGVPGKTRFLALFTPEGTGGFPNVMIVNDDFDGGNSNIHFSDVIFDFAKPPGVGYEVGPGLTSNNGLRLKNVQAMTFTNVEFVNFVTNLDSTIPVAGMAAFNSVYIEECDDVALRGVRLDNLREEGPCFYLCKNVSIDGLFANGAASDGSYNTSSFFAFWYCDGVTVRNARIIHTGGSVFNCCSRNVRYERIKVERSPVRGGAGFDFGNELGAQAFDVANIVIDQCDIDVDSYGVQCESAASNVDPIEGLRVTNCKINVLEKGSALHGFLIQSSTNVEISNNYITLGASTAGYRGRAFRIAVPSGAIAGPISIKDNVVASLAFIDMTAGTPWTLKKLVISGNLWTAQARGSFAVSDAAGCFMRIITQNAGAGYSFKNIIVRDNTLIGLDCLLYSSFANPALVSWDEWVWSGNYVEGPASAMMNTSFIVSGADGGRKHLVFDRNKLVRFHDLHLVKLRKLHGAGNYFDVHQSLVVASSRVKLNAPDAIEIVWTNNFHSYVNASSGSAFQETAAGTYALVWIKDSAERHTSGSLVHSRAGVPANTSLPT